jgi:hypothetical protein
MLDLSCKIGVGGSQSFHTGLQAKGIQGTEREGAMAALGATLSADEVLTRARGRVGE